MVVGNNAMCIQLDRGRIKYSIPGKNIDIEIEHSMGEVSIFKNSIKNWLPPNSGEEVDEITRRKIIDDVSNAMRLLGIKYILE